jgi:hypothetical protein
LRPLPAVPTTLFIAITLLGAGCDGEEETDAGVDSGSTDAGQDAGPRDAGPFDAGNGECVGPPGLYVEGSCEITQPGVRSFTPRFVLWSDDADKERFIYLPPGSNIITDDPDNWAFPVGTRVYKTFSHDGVRLETRLLEKISTGVGPSTWRMVSYAWNAAQNAVTEAPVTGMQNVLGTQHDIPSGEDCQSCHSGSLDVLNGFSAIQLNHSGTAVSLQTLIDEARLVTINTPITAADADAPGQGTSAQAALGYLHANCGHCHRAAPMEADDCGRLPVGLASSACRTGLHMWLRVADETVEDTTSFTTGVGQFSNYRIDFATTPCRIEPMDTEHSVALLRMMSRTTSVEMPPLGTEIPDPAGIATLEAWIADLPATPAGGGTWPCLP